LIVATTPTIDRKRFREVRGIVSGATALVE
jgi:uncharacterized protein YbjQ (UPF0145 family)